MKITDVIITRNEVDGYPQLSVKEPSISELAEIAVRFEGFNVLDKEDDAAPNTVCWFLKTFVGDENGDPLEAIEPETILDVVSNSLLLACINATRGDIDKDEDDVPE